MPLSYTFQILIWFYLQMHKQSKMEANRHYNSIQKIPYINKTRKSDVIRFLQNENMFDRNIKGQIKLPVGCQLIIYGLKTII